MATNEAATTTATVPSALAFLVSNFHSLVNIKLDGSNYMLWRIQVESVMEANGFYGYLDGSIQPPSSEIRNVQGDISVNPAYTLWKLIDSQLKSCLNASLTQVTLPYVLGLRHAYQIWDSLGKRYNTITESHVQELKDELYSVSKTSTIEAEDVQLSKETSDLEGSNTVLIASHSNPQKNSNLGPVYNRGVAPSGCGSGNQDFAQQQIGSQQYFPSHSSQFGSSSSRNFNRGKGGRKFHCDICGRNNHSTNFCYYRPNGPGVQWKGYSNTPQMYPPMFGSHGMPGIPMVQSVPSQFSATQGQIGGFFSAP
ncbi:hypothetical protein Vadar_030766 [Vaccinium darrowii]|uniref:Uncharacterized protein n=1 Tax=Vaccinium darrowii TaxID=229202 RepID=A0ACB7ZFJ2_9ERIC|nr:hypothetical protein Vadar_030766 [Vaccinium darrowii]